MRDRIAIGFAAVVVLAVGAAGVWFLLLRETAPTREEQAAAAVDAFVAAWEDGDWRTLGGLTSRPEEAAATHARAWADLRVAGTTITAERATARRGQADADLTVELSLVDLGAWSYETRVTLLRDQGRWRVDWTPATVHPELDEGLRFAQQVTDEPARAPILDHRGTPLAERREVVAAGIHPARLDDPGDVVRAFEEHAGVDPDRVRRLLAQDLNPEWFYPVTTLDPEADRRTVDLLRPFPGIVFQRQERRVAVTEELGAHLVGEVGEITAEQLEQLGQGYRPGDLVGRSGLERIFEDQLTGEASGRVVLVEPPAPSATPAPTEEPSVEERDVRQVLAEFGGSEPAPVRTTLDLEVQRALEGAVADLDATLGAVALHAPTGAIRAVVSRPLDQPFNRALDGLYAPGSTFKVVTAAAVLSELGVGTAVTCPAEVTVGGKRFGNVDDLDLGEIDLETAFVRSCNTAFVQLAEDLGGDDLDRWAQRFGFGRDHDLPVPSSGGAFPPPADLAERAAAAIGQGRVQASPLHMATVMGAVAAGGWRPSHLLQEDGEEGVEPTRLPSGDLDRLRRLLRGVVESGTGTAAQVEGEPVHGKTGSAEFGEAPADGGDLPTHAWFIGFRGDLAFAVLVEGGGSGGEVAAPIAARFLTALGS